MKLLRFRAINVYGQLNFDIGFGDECTFLVGLNGSGKTTVLRLIMALITPDVAEMSSAQFDEIEVIVSDGNEQRSISAYRSVEGMTLKVSSTGEELFLPLSELALLEDARSPTKDGSSLILKKISDSMVFGEIQKIATPMFLGLDRRFKGDSFSDPMSIRRGEFIVNRVEMDQEAVRRGNVAAALFDVAVLVYDAIADIRERQEKLDSEFRNKLIVSALQYQRTEFGEIQLPSTHSIVQYREKRTEIEQSVSNLKIPLVDVADALTLFFDRMNQIAKDLEHIGEARASVSEPKKGGKQTRKYGASIPPERPPEPTESILEWFVNKPQVDRITSLLALLSDYGDQRKMLRQSIDRFIDLINSFLKDTGKRVSVNDRGSLTVAMEGGKTGSVGILSSGERQLLVMLGHLALNPRLTNSGVFIVDEPELSLHISWQERLVEAVNKANPLVQLIFATHSPAIILERDDFCVSLDGSWRKDAQMAS